MILYIHGFSSKGNGRKFESLKNVFCSTEAQDPDFPICVSREELISPSLPKSPKKAIELLISTIEEGSIVVGTSLGGFYAVYLAAVRPDLASSVLALNPAVRPSEKLKRFLGQVKIFGTEESFEWTQTDLDELKELEDELLSIDVDSFKSSVKIAIGIHDEFTNEDEVKSYFKCPNIKKYDDGHRFDNYFEQAVEDAFLKTNGF